jgi:hypothetical protein
MSADTELASWDSSEATSDAASENGSMRVEGAIAAVQSEGTRAYLTISPDPFSNPDTESCRHDTSPAASEDVGPKRVQILWETERQWVMVEFIFEPAASTATSKLRG